MVRETRYLIVRNLPENCTEETVIDHFQRYGKIQSVKLQTAKDNDSGQTATVAFNDIKSAAKAHHAKNSLGEVTLRTDYWEGSTGTVVLANAANSSTPTTSGSSIRSGNGSYASSTSTASTPRPVSTTFSSWTKSSPEEESSAAQDKGEANQAVTVGISTPTLGTSSSALDKLSSTSFDLQRGRARERFSKKKFGVKGFEKTTGSFGRHGTTTSSRSLEAMRSQSEAAVAAAAAAAVTPSSGGTTVPSNPTLNTSVLNPIIVSDSKDLTTKEASKDSTKESRSRPRSLASPSSRHSGGGGGQAKRSNSVSMSVSPSRSRSHGSRSSSSHSDSSGTSRSTSPHRHYNSSGARPQSMVGASRLVSSEVKEASKKDEEEGDRKPLGICVTGLPVRSTDSSLRDGLYHEYKKHGKVTCVHVFGQGEDRYAVVSFRKPEDASKALEASQGKTFFGAKIKVISHEGVEVDDNDPRMNDADSMDEYHMKSTRTLFVGNLTKETTVQDLMDKFKPYGEIIDVDIKRQGATTAFAFVQYTDIVSVVGALKAMEGEHIGINKIKLGFGKSMPTCCVWVDNIPLDTNTRTLKNWFDRYGEVNYCYVDRKRGKGLIYYTSYDDAQRCVSDIKIRPSILKKKVQIDFASRECQTNFLDKMEESDQLRSSERHDDRGTHKFRQQRSFDSYQEDGSPSAYGYNSRNQGSYSSRNGRTSSTGYRSRVSRPFDSNYGEENSSYSSSRRVARRPEDYTQSGSYFKGDDYDQVLRDYGHSQRERRERDHHSPRRSLDRRDDQSHRSSRDHSLDRYDERSKDRHIDVYNSREGSPSSEHNSYRSESRYRSLRDEKYSSRDRYEDGKGDDLHSRVSHVASPIYNNHSHDSDYGRHGSRSQSPATPTQEESYNRMFYSEDYKRSVVADGDYDSYSNSQKRRDFDESSGGKLKPWSSMLSIKLGAEMAKTVEKSRKRSHEESGLGESCKSDVKVLKKLEKSSGSLSSKDKMRLIHEQLKTKRRLTKADCSPASPGSHIDSENGSASEGDLHHLHQEKQQLLLELQELHEEGTSDPDSPHSAAKIKSVAVKEALRQSGRNPADKRREDHLRREINHKHNDKRYSLSKSGRDSVNDELGSMREDKTPVVDLDDGDSDSDYDSNSRPSKKRRLDCKDSRKNLPRTNGSTECSDSEGYERTLDSALVERGVCDSFGSRSKFFDKKFLDNSCDSADVSKNGLSDRDLSVINNHRTSAKSHSQFPDNDDYAGRDSPVGLFSPAGSEDNTQDSVTSGSFTEKGSSKHLSPLRWEHSPPNSLTGKDNSESEYNFYKDYLPSASPPLPEDSLSDDSLCETPQVPGEPSLEDRIRAIDEILNMAASSKAADQSLLLTSFPNKDVTNNNDNISAHYSKFRIRKRDTASSVGKEGALSEKKPEPSVIMKQVLSKKSILDQDFKRLEQMNEKYDPGAVVQNVRESDMSLIPLIKVEADLPQLSNAIIDKMGQKPVSSSSPLAPLPSSHDVSSLSSVTSSVPQPITMSSSMLQPTVTATLAGAGMASPSTSSVYTSVVVSSVCSKSDIVKSEDGTLSGNGSINKSEDTPQPCPLALSLNSKQNCQSSSLSSTYCVSSLTTSSIAVPSLPSLSHCDSSSFPSTASTLITSSSPLLSTLSPSSTMSSSLTVSPLPSVSQVSSSHLSPKCSPSSMPVSFPSRLPSKSLFTTSTPAQLPQINPSLSCPSEPPGGPGSAATPFTQGPDNKSLLTPTPGQEAPHLPSPSFTTDKYQTSSAHESIQLANLKAEQDELHSITCKTEEKILNTQDLKKEDSDASCDSDVAKKPSACKDEVLVSEMESPLSEKSETSSIASVPLSSLESKACSKNPHNLAPLSVNIEASSPIRKATCSLSPLEINSSLISDVKSELSIDSAVSCLDSGMDSVTGKKSFEVMDLLSSKDSCFPTTSTSTAVLSVTGEVSMEKKDITVLDNFIGIGGMSNHVDSTPKTIPKMTHVPVSSASGTSSSSSSSLSSSGPALSAVTKSKQEGDKNDRKTPSKSSTHHSKASGSSKSEPLFAPDVKLEANQKHGDSRHGNGSKEKASSNNQSKSSSGSNSDRKSPKLSQKESSQDKKEGEQSEKAEKKSMDSSQKNFEKSRHDYKAKESGSEKAKLKEKRDHSKEADRSKQKDKDKDDSRKERAAAEKEKKEEKKSSMREEKKVEKKTEEKSKPKETASNQGGKSQLKSDGDSLKKDKAVKNKDKGKETSKDRGKPNEKKVLSGLSCIGSKHSTSPAAKSESKPTKTEHKDNKAASKGDAASKDGTSGKAEKDGFGSKTDAPRAGDSKSGAKAERSKTDAKISKSSMEAKEESKDMATSAKKSHLDLTKQKSKDSEKDGSKGHISSKITEKAQKKQREEEKAKEKLKLKEDRQKEKEREEKERKEKERLEKENEEKERLKEKERLEREEREKKERDEREREEKEREERERKEREEKERLKKEKEEKERKEREEKERLRKEKEEREKQKEKEKEEKEKQKQKQREEKERLEKEKKEREEKEKQKEKERKEKEKREKEKKEKERKEKEKKEKERKEKEKKAKEEKLKKEKEEKARKEKEEKEKKEKNEKNKKEKSKEREKEEKEKEDKDKKKVQPKKPKRNELAALLDSNDAFQMTFTSMYDRVKTQRNREPEQSAKSESSAKSSFDKFKKKREKKGSKAKSSLYSYGSTSDLSDDNDDNLSDLSESENDEKPEPVKESKPKTKQMKKRPHVSSSSSSSCEDDEDELLRATKPKGKKADFNDIFNSSESDNDESFQAPQSKSKTGNKQKSKPTPKRRKTREDSSDSVASKDDFIKPNKKSSSNVYLSSVTETESHDDEMDISEAESIKSTKTKKKKKMKSATHEKRDSSVESVSKKPNKTERDSSAEPPTKKSVSKKEISIDPSPKKNNNKSDDKSSSKADVSKEDSKKTKDNQKEKAGKKSKVEEDKGSKTSKNEANEKAEEAMKADLAKKKKKKKKFDPKEEEELVNSLITKVYDKKLDKEEKHKKKRTNVFDSESEDFPKSEKSVDLSADEKSPVKETKKEDAPEVKVNDKKVEKVEKVEKSHDNKAADLKKELHEDEKKNKHETEKKKEITEKKMKNDAKTEEKEKLKEVKSEPVSEEPHHKPPKKKKKKKDHEAEKEDAIVPEKPPKASPEKKSDHDKNSPGLEEKAGSQTQDKAVDEFISFWGHPKPILIPRRFKDSKKLNEDDKSKKEDTTKAEEKSEKKKEESKQVKEEKEAAGKSETEDSKSKTESSTECKMQDVAGTVKVELDAIDDTIVPISEAETTVVSEACPPSAESTLSNSDLQIGQEESAESTPIIPNETSLGLSVEIDDDDYPSLVIDVIDESSEKKKLTKKDKRLLKKQQEKELSDHMDEVIAKVAMAGSSDDDDKPSPLTIETTSSDKELLLSDVINQINYDNKLDSTQRKSSVVSDIIFPDKDEKKTIKSLEKPSLVGKEKEDKFSSSALATKKEQSKKEEGNSKEFGLIDEETKKRDEEVLKSLAVLCEPNMGNQVVIEDGPPKPTEEELKKIEEEEKKKLEEEKKKAEEEEKQRQEREQREVSAEAARAVQTLLESQSSFDREPMGVGEPELPPLYIEPAEKEPPMEETKIEPEPIVVSVLSNNTLLPEKTTISLDDKLPAFQDKNLEDGKDPVDPFMLFPISMPSPRRISGGLSKEKTPEPQTIPPLQQPMPSPQMQLQSPQRPIQSPQMPLHSPQQPLQSPQRQMQSPQRQMQSPQRQMQSPQRQMQSPQRQMPSPQRQLPSPQCLQSPQRALPPSQISMHSPNISLPSNQRAGPALPKDGKNERGFFSPKRDMPFGSTDQAPPDTSMHARRGSVPYPNPPMIETKESIFPRRKSQEFHADPVYPGPRRNTISTSDPSTTVANLDMKFPQRPGVNLKEGLHISHSTLPAPVSISLDHPPNQIPMDKNFQAPVRNLSIPPHQDNQLATKKISQPQAQHKDSQPQEPLMVFSPPHKVTSPDPMFLPGKGNFPDQRFMQQRMPPQEHLSQHNKNALQEPVFSPKSQDQLLYRLSGAKGPTGQDPSHLIGKAQEQLYKLGKGPQEMGTPISKPPSGTLSMQHEFSNRDQPVDLLLNTPPPRNHAGFFPYPQTSEANKASSMKQNETIEPSMLNPLFSPPTQESGMRFLERDMLPNRRMEGFPPSFYKEPALKPYSDTTNLQQQLQQQQQQQQQQLQQQQQQAPQSQLLSEDDKKGTKKRKRVNKKCTKEDREAALAEQQAIEESVQANVESIHKALSANQQRAAAEKGGLRGMNDKKAIDAYDFDAQASQDIENTSVDTHGPLIESEVRGTRATRGERGRGRGSARGRGRRGRGGSIPMQDFHDAMMSRSDQHPHHPLLHTGPGNQERFPPSHPTAPYQHHQMLHSPPHHIPQEPLHHQSIPPNQNTLPPPPASHPAPYHQQLPQANEIPPSNSGAPDWTQKQFAPQPDSQIAHLPMKPSSVKSDVLSPESKLDLDSSCGEADLVINLEYQPPSIEGKENQYTANSDLDEQGGSITSPSTPSNKNQRSTRPRKRTDYKAIASGQQVVPPRSSRSGGSPRSARSIGGQSPKSGNSPRTRSSENVGSSPVVKLEKLEDQRTTRRSRDLMKKDEMSEETHSSSFEDWKASKGHQEESKTVSKENIYEFDDTEQESRIEPTILRVTRDRKKRLSEPMTPESNLVKQQQPQHALSIVDYMPTSPASSTTSSSYISETKVTLDLNMSSDPPSVVEDSRSTPLSNAVAVIDAVSKGIFGPSDEDSGTPEPATPEPATGATTRSSKRILEMAKKNAEEQKNDKTSFSVAEVPKTDSRPGRKGLTVPPLRIKVDKNDEKPHYVIEQPEHGEKSSLSITVKLSDTGTATIKPPGKVQSSGSTEKEESSAEKSGSKSGHLGLFSGMPQNDQGKGNVIVTKSNTPTSQTGSWKQADIAMKEDNKQAENNPPSKGSVSESANAPLPVQVSIAMAASPDVPKLSSASNYQPIKHTWDMPQEGTQSGVPLSPSHHPPHMQKTSVSSIVSQPPQRPLSAHQDVMGKRPPSVHQEPPGKRPPSAHNSRPGKGGKMSGMEVNADMPTKLPVEAAGGLHQSQFGFPHVQPAHSGPRPFLMPPDQGGHHPMHFPSSFKSTADQRSSKSPSVLPQPHKLGGDVRARTPPVTSGAMLYSGVVSGQPISLSPKSTSPEGQTIERLPNPLRQDAASPPGNPMGMRIPNPIHPESLRGLKEEFRDATQPIHPENSAAQSRNVAMMRHMMEERIRFQQMTLNARASPRNTPTPQESNRNAEVTRNMAAARNSVINAHEQSLGHDPQIPSGQQGQPLNLSEPEGRGHPDPARVTPKSTPSAPQSPFSLPYMDRKVENSHLPSGVSSAFMQPSPGGHREGIPPHLYPPELSMGLPLRQYGVVGGYPIDPRTVYSPSQQPPPHIMAGREGVMPPFPQGFSPGARFPGMEQLVDKKGETPHQEQAPARGLLGARSPSPGSRQLQADLMRQSMNRMACDIPARDGPVGILQRYPVMWQGVLALKNDNSYVQMHFIAGNRRLPNQALPQPLPNSNLSPLRISQRMRLEQAQLEGVAKRMLCEDDFCILIAVACGRDQMDISQQTRALNEGFITYLLNKQAAGIVNVPLPGSEQAGFVVHIFPPCEFVDSSVIKHGSLALMEQMREVPHAVIIIATT